MRTYNSFEKMPKNDTGMKIGELVKSLQKEFPNISVSKVRYFEDQGLIFPKRDESGYRRYSASDLQRLKWILKTQRDEYLPLEVIASRLHSRDFSPAKNEEKELFINEKAKTRQLTEKDLEKAGRISFKQLSSLKECGILGQGPIYTEDDLEIISAVRALLLTGIEPRHLKFLMRSAEQESDLAMQIISPELKKMEARQAYLKLDELVESNSALRQALLRRELRQSLNGIE